MVGKLPFLMVILQELVQILYINTIQYLDTSEVGKLSLLMVMLQELVKIFPAREEPVRHLLALLLNLSACELLLLKDISTSWFAASRSASKVSGLTLPCFVSKAAFSSRTCNRIL